MIAPRTLSPLHLRALLSLALFGAAIVRAQPPVLAPTVDTYIVVPAGPLHYSSIHVPVGVTLGFVAPGGPFMPVPNQPAVVICDGDVIVEGTLDMWGDYVTGFGAGFVHTGTGSGGGYCGMTFVGPPGGGRHAGMYGTVLPFALEGGSEGGPTTYYDSSCTQYLSLAPGGRGAGTLVLLAGGHIEVHGRIRADGAGGLAGGSGGSILLRGEAGVAVMPGGSVTARGGPGYPPPSPYPFTFSDGEPGFIRLDSWGVPPMIAGVVDPPPTVLELPYLRMATPPTYGTTWIFHVYAPVSSWVFVAAALAPASGSPMTPFGPLGLDLAGMAGILTLSVPLPSHDPSASVLWPIPQSSALQGLGVWIQALAAPPGLPPRLTNTLSVVVQ